MKTTQKNRLFVFLVIISLLISLISPLTFAEDEKKVKVIENNALKLGNFAKLTIIEKTTQSNQKHSLLGAFESSTSNYSVLGVVARDAAILSNPNNSLREIIDIPSEKVTTPNYEVILPFISLSEVVEICDDGIDNNGNSLTDCADPDCPGFDKANILDYNIPSSFECHQTLSANVTVNNTGCTTWTAAELYKLGAINESSTFIPEDINVAGTTAIGESTIFLFNMTAPNINNTYLSGWQMKHNLTYFGDYISQSITVSQGTEVCNDGLDNDCDSLIDCADSDCSEFIDSAYVSDTIPATISCNNQTLADITFQNTGCKEWTTDDLLDLFNDSSLFMHTNSIQLQNNTTKDENISIPLQMFIPSQTRSYLLGFQLNNTIINFGEFKNKTINVTGTCNVSDIIITDPETGDVVNGTINVSFFNPVNNSAQVSIDGLYWNDTTSYDYSEWNTDLEQEGLHTVQVRDWDYSSSEYVYSNIVTVIVRRLPGVFDDTPPTNMTVWDDGNWTNNKTSLHARWYGFDRESKVFYKFQIYDEDDNKCIYPKSGEGSACDFSLPSEYWEDAPLFGLAEEVTVTNGTDNVTFELDEDDEGHNYTFRVVAMNSYFLYDLNTSYNTSDGILTDFTEPNKPDIDSESHPTQTLWYNKSDVEFDWTKPGDPDPDPYLASEVKGFSYVLTTDINETPDYVADGDPEHLLDELNHTYTGLGDGTYYFRVRAEDNAGNWGGFDEYIVKIDVTPPGPPQINQSDYSIGQGEALTIEWLASQDGSGSQIDYYIIETNYQNGTSAYSNTTSPTTDKTFSAGVLPEGDLHFRIYAVDNVGWISDPSDSVTGLIDTIAPTILFIKPKGTILTAQPKVEVWLDEIASCKVNGVLFAFNESAINVHKILLTSSPTTLIIECEDTVRNSVTDSVSVSVDTSASITDFTITTQEPYYIGQGITLDIDTSPDLGEIPPGQFNVKLDNITLQDITIRDLSQGDYEIEFTAPITAGDYNITITIQGIEKTILITITDLEFGVGFSSDFSTQSDRISYGLFDNATIGIASDSSEATVTQSSVSSSIVDGYTYIFVTTPNAQPENRERLLKNNQFDGLFNPSFGYQIERDSYQINTEIGYEDIKIQGKEKLPGGRYNLIIKNKGTDPSTGQTIIEVEIV